MIRLKINLKNSLNKKTIIKNYKQKDVEEKKGKKSYRLRKQTEVETTKEMKEYDCK